MTNIIQEEIIRKVYGIMGSNTRMELYRKDLMLFVRVLYKDANVGEDLIDAYDSVESIEVAAKALCEVFVNCVYVGELK